jgi:hypothetical protein
MSNDKKISLLFLSLIMIIVSGVFVSSEMIVNTYAASRDFTVVSGLDKINVCSCASGTDAFTVINTGTYPAIFTINIDSATAQLSENSFELQPGQSKDVMLAITAACSDGKKALTIDISSNLGVRKTIQKQIVISKCQNLELWLSVDNQTVNPCQDSVFTLYVKNSGSFPEEYKVSSDNDAYITYSSNYFTLLPNQIAQVIARANFGCAVYGEKNVVFNAHSEKNGLDAKITARLDIKKDYDYTIVVDNVLDSDNISYRQSIDACNKVYVQSVPVTITNNGVANNFTLETKNLPKYVSIWGIDDSEMKFSLAKGQSKTFYLNTDIHDFINEYKGYDFSLIFKPALGDIVKTKNLRINTRPCYDPVVDIVVDNTKDDPLKICSGEQYDYDIKISNNGIFTEKLLLHLEGQSEGMKLSTQELTVAPQDAKIITLNVKAPENNELYDVKAFATLSNGLYVQDNVWMQSYTMYNCHLLEFGKDDFRINYDTQYIDVPIKNAGIIPGEYKIALADSELFSLENKIVTIDAGASENIRLNIDSVNKTERIYYANLTITDMSSDTSYYQSVEVTLKDKSVFRKAFEFFAFGTMCRQISMWELVAILIICVLIIFFMIKGPHYPYKLGNRIKQKLPILIVLLVIFLIGLAFVIMIAGLPKTHDQVYNLTSDYQQLEFETLQDNKFILNVGSFFIDPDNNTLLYNVSDMENIKAVVKDAQVILYPDLGFSGERTFRITAYDDQGGSIESPKMTLRVIPNPEKSVTEMYDIYCWYINLAIFAIALILIFLIFIVKQKKRARK